jgi:hypothetical protein
METKSTQHASRVRLLLVISFASLIAFGVNAWIIGSNGGVYSASPLPLTALLSYFLAAAALGTAIAANASAYLNHASPHVTKIIAPLMLLLVFAAILPFFISLGSTIVE